MKQFKQDLDASQKRLDEREEMMRLIDAEIDGLRDERDVLEMEVKEEDGLLEDEVKGLSNKDSVCYRNLMTPAEFIQFKILELKMRNSKVAFAQEREEEVLEELKEELEVWKKKKVVH